MAESFNVLQEEVKEAALGLDEARENMRTARAELIARHEQIAHLAHHDALTDLPNRTRSPAGWTSAFDQREGDSNAASPCSAIDLDHFKEANDVFGHVVGDELLCAIARRLEVAAEGAFVARVGGDEFTFVSAAGEQPKPRRCWPSAAARRWRSRSRSAARRSPSASASARPSIRTTAADTETLLANADAALYRAKADGRHTVRFFDPDMDRRLRERYALQHDLRSAIAHNELVLHYQPQATIDGEVFGFEALVRWQHPEARAGRAQRRSSRSPSRTA